MAIRYDSDYTHSGFGVSDDSVDSARVFKYRLSTGAAWDVPIERGRVVLRGVGINFEDLAVLKPLNRFNKTAADHSAQLREGIRRVGSDEERRSRIGAWRESGRIQAYNWMEPLMPRPFSEVIWVPAAKVDELKRRRLSLEAAESLDGRLGFEARHSGELGRSLSVTDFNGLGRLADSSIPIAVTLDLDFFAGRRIGVAEAIAVCRLGSCAAAFGD